MASWIRFYTRNTILVVCILVLPLLLGPDAILASSWPHDPLENLSLCSAEGWRDYLAAAPDEDGGAFVAWCDWRGGINSDLFAQHVDAYGNLLWTVDGEIICNESDNQCGAVAVSDGAGGAIFAWEDERNGADTDIYAQRLDRDGAAWWGYGGTAVSVEPFNVDGLVICSDGAGGAIIAWVDDRSDLGDIYAQRVDGDGYVLWDPMGEPVCAVEGRQYDVWIASDGAGGAFFVWNDGRPTSPGIYAQRVGSNGDNLWAPFDGRAVCTASGNKLQPRLVPNGMGGVIITWEDFRTEGGVFAQRVDGNGTTVWAADGVMVCEYLGAFGKVIPVADGTGGALIAWSDNRNGYFDIHAQRIDPDGNTLWTENGAVVCGASNQQFLEAAASDGAGGLVASWVDERWNGTDVYAQRLDEWANPVWTINGVAVSTALSNQFGVVMASDGSGGAIVAWKDYRFQWGKDRDTEVAVFAQRVEAHGYLGHPSPNITDVMDSPQDQGGSILVSWEPSYLDVYPHEVVSTYSVWRKYLGGASKSHDGRAAKHGPFREGLYADLADRLTRAG